MRGIRLGARGARARATCAGTSALTLPRRLRGLYAMLVFRRFAACLQLEREELDGPDGAGGKEPRALLRGQQCSACQKRRRVPLTCALFDLPRRTAQFDQWRYIIYFAITLVGGSFPSIKQKFKKETGFGPQRVSGGQGKQATTMSAAVGLTPPVTTELINPAQLRPLFCPPCPGVHSVFLNMSLRNMHGPARIIKGQRAHGR